MNIYVMNLTATVLRRNILTSKTDISESKSGLNEPCRQCQKRGASFLKPCRNFVRMSFSGLNPGSYTIVCIRKN